VTRIIGIDLGAYSVKVVVANPGFRSANVIDFYERLVPPGDEPSDSRAARVLGELLRENRLHQDSAFASLSGDRVFIHVLEFGFKSLRRAELTKAVGAELEGILPIDLEDMVYTFEPLPKDALKSPAEVPALGGLAPDAEPAFATPSAQAGPVAEPTAGMRVLACASMSARIRSFLELLDREGAEPRGLIAAPASYPRVLERIAAAGQAAGGKAPAAPASAIPPTAVIDVGHERTDVCVVASGRAAFVRTIARGGKALSEFIARTWQIPFDRAEAAKHQDGFIASAAEPAPSEQWARIDQALRPDLEALARDLRKTLVGCQAKTGVVAERVILVGGTSRLRGLASFLSEQLRIPVSTLSPAEDQAILGQRLAGLGVRADMASLAAGVTFEGATGRPSFDLRQGDLSFKADLSFLRARAVPLAAAALAVIAFAALSAYANLWKLRKAEKALDTRLALETVQVFGRQMSASDVLEQVSPTGAATDNPMPKMTAWDLLLAFNEVLPPKTEVKIDIGDVDIKPGKVSVRGVSAPTDSQRALKGIKTLEESLKGSTCFADVTSQSQPGRDDSLEFTLTIKTSEECL
jgi:general secretion pathway protein L